MQWTPMMDLLVQVTTAHKVNPGGHVIHLPTDRGRDFLQYKPNTPIGSLDTNSIHIVPKSAVFDPPIKKMPKMANKPFEQTFRLQVNLPRNQLMVMRVGPRTTLAEVKIQACQEKNLDPSRYTLTHPQRQDALLDLSSSMSAYGATEITLISNSIFNTNMCNSTSDLIAYTAREENQKKKSLLGLFARKKSKASIVDSSSDSLDSRGVSPSRSDSSGPRNCSAKVPVKKRPAPPPPPPRSSSQKTEPNNKTKNNTPASTPVPITTLMPPNEKAMGKSDGSTISHSRHSSDSSGYHEASLLSESPENRSPDVCSGSGSSGLSLENFTHPVTTTRRKSSTPPKSTQDKTRPILTSLSDTQLVANNRKRRAPPPPPTLLQQSEGANDIRKTSLGEKMEEVIVEEPITEYFEEEVRVSGPESKTPSPEPASSPPVSEAESGLVEDIEPPLPLLLLTASPSSEESPPASPHTDSGLNLDDTQEDSEDVDMDNSCGKARKPSLTSLETIEDVQNAFDLTIAEAEKALEDEDKRLSFCSNPCLEKQGIEKANEVNETESKVLLHVKPSIVTLQENDNRIENKEPYSPVKEYGSGWNYTIPEPPPAFRNDASLESKNNLSNKEVLPVRQSLHSSPVEDSTDSYQERKAVTKYVSRSSELPVISCPAPVLLKVKTPDFKEPLSANRESLVVKSSLPLYTKASVKESSSVNVKFVETRATVERQPSKLRRPPLLNFRIETYKTSNEDIFSNCNATKPVPKSAPVIMREVHTIPVTDYTSLDLPKTPVSSSSLVYGTEGSVRGVKGQVQQRRTDMTDVNASNLVGRSASMLNLSPTTRRTDMDGSMKTAQRTTSSASEVLRKAQSVQDLKSDENSSDADLEQEQERLQQEYTKLHEQFLVWNQQLQDNQNLLEKQKIVSASTLLPLPVNVQNNNNNSKDNNKNNIITCSSVTAVEDVAARSQTLPRTKPKPVFPQAAQEKHTFTLDRRSKPQILTNVSIGSWQQRKSTENISTLSVTEKSQPQRTDDPISVVAESKTNGHLYSSDKTSVSKRPVSMYAAWQKPVVAEPEKEKPKFNIQFSSSQSWQVNSLRTSSNKTTFKPPEIRTSSASRQRIPPGNIVAPTEEFNSSVVNCKKQSVCDQRQPSESYGKTVTYLNTDKPRNGTSVKSLNMIEKVCMNNGLSQRPSFSVKTAPRVVGFRINGISEPTTSVRLSVPPDPPPTSTILVSHVPSKGLNPVKPDPVTKGPSSHSVKNNQLLKVSPLDPREELMLQIRNFGGRKTLRKVAEGQTSWELKVHGSNSIITA